MKTMKYKKYIGSAEVDFDENILHGKLLYIKDLVTFEASSPSGLEVEFHAAVDDYLADCQDMGVEPDTPFKGQFNVRVTPGLHRELSVSARAQDKSLNEYVATVLNCHEQVGANGNIHQTSSHNVVFVAPASMASSHRTGQMNYLFSSSNRCRFGGSDAPQTVAGVSQWFTKGKQDVKH